MLPKNLRIKVAEFNSIREKARKFHFPLFTIFSKNYRGGCRVSISVPKSVDKRSSVRNFTKRCIEQIILGNRLNLKKDTAALIRVKSVFSEGNSAVFHRDILSFFIAKKGSAE